MTIYDAKIHENHLFKVKAAMEKVKQTRGGRREGAGRPKGDSKLYSFRCPGDLARELDAKADRTGFIRDSLRKALSQEASGPGFGDVTGTSGPALDGVVGASGPGFGNVVEASGPALNGVVGAPRPGLGDVTGTSGHGFGDVFAASAVRPVHLPYFDARVVAGFPVPLDNDERSQDIELLSMLCPHPEASYLIRVKGDSMIDAGILSGDIVIVDKSNRTPSPREIAVCELNGEFTLKRFVEEEGRGWLIPANPEYPRIPVTRDDDFSIWGTVTYIIHKARD